VLLAIGPAIFGEFLKFATSERLADVGVCGAQSEAVVNIARYDRD
jgi:hypothetical protein